MKLALGEDKLIYNLLNYIFIAFFIKFKCLEPPFQKWIIKIKLKCFYMFKLKVLIIQSLL
jgi:hypothetical protein